MLPGKCGQDMLARRRGASVIGSIDVCLSNS